MLIHFFDQDVVLVTKFKELEVVHELGMGFYVLNDVLLVLLDVQKLYYLVQLCQLFDTQRN